MALNPLPGSATASAKVGDVNALIEALNAALAAVNQNFENRFDRLALRVDTLEAEPDPVMPPDLTTRVEALEALIVRSPAESPGPGLTVTEPPRPPNLDATQPQLVYNQATLYYRDVELHAQRIGETRWLLRSRLNYIVISPAEWTYEEIIDGTPDEIYAHAQRRLVELAELKPQHDAVHARVREMSEGR